MTVGDLVYHIDDWADMKPIVGVVLSFRSVASAKGGVGVLFTDRVALEYWPKRELRPFWKEEKNE